MSELIAKIKVSRPELWPTKNHETDACYDLRADLSNWPTDDLDFIDGKLYLGSLQRKIIPSGVFVEIPVGFKTAVYPRSGLAAKHGITILNSPGTVDAGYRDEIKTILYNSDPCSAFVIKDLDRIAQMEFVALQPTILYRMKEDETFSPSDRGSKGLGSSGVK